MAKAAPRRMSSPKLVPGSKADKAMEAKMGMKPGSKADMMMEKGMMPKGTKKGK